MIRRAAAVALVASVIIGTGVVGARPDTAASAAPSSCAASTSTADLNSLFAGQVGDLVGFDATVVLPLPDGRSLWLVQDAFITPTPGVTAASLRPPVSFAHNAAMVQAGNCFTPLHGPLTPGDHCSVQDASFIGRDLTASCSRWFWPMSGAIDSNGDLAVFMAEWVNPQATGAQPPAELSSVWLARLDPVTFEVLSFGPAPDPGGDRGFGHWITDDTTYSYLYGCSHDHFNRPDPLTTPECEAYIARVPLGEFDLVPEYWNGAMWVTDRSVAVPMLERTEGIDRAASDHVQPRRFGDTWVTVIKDRGWWSHSARVDVADRPEGPWTTVQTLTVPTRTLDGATNTYETHLLPWRSAQGNLVITMSNNAWQFDPVALDNPWIYRQTFFELEAPAGLERGAPPAELSEPLAFVPRSSPARALDTRTSTRLATGETRRLDLAAFVGPETRAAAVNLTIVDPSAATWLAAWPCDQTWPGTSNVNAPAHSIRAAHAVVALDGSKGICLLASASTHVVVDVFGSYVPPTSKGALGYHPLEPTRIYDSRDTTRWSAGETRGIPAPAGAAAVAVNVTLTEPTRSGFVTVYPCGTTRPFVSNVNVVPGQTVANLVEVGTTGGEICIYSLQPTHVVVDLVGTFDTGVGGLHYQPVGPTRIVDTRVGVGSVIGRVAIAAGAFGLLPANAPVALSMLPEQVRALMVSMIAVVPTAPGWGLITPCNEPDYLVPYSSSTLNFAAGDIVANTSIVATRAVTGRAVCTFSLVPAYHVVDLVGWFVE